MSNREKSCKNLAHRGASGYAPENTMVAFRRAEQLGADGFELDVLLTRDGVPVVIHDETLDRTTDGKGWVHQHTYAELLHLDAGSWFAPAFAGEKIPTLEQVIAEFGKRMFLNIELKNSYIPMPQLEAKVIELIRRYGVEKNCLVSSFDHHSVADFHELAPEIPIGLLYDCILVHAHEYAKRVGAMALHPYFRCTTKKLVDAAHAEGLQVNVWTVNETSDMHWMLAIGVDAIITNYPDRLRDVLDGKR
jgi:glycerophosphoryl diester phosphodiesterase